MLVDFLLAEGSLIGDGLIAAFDFLAFPVSAFTSSAETSVADLLFAALLFVGATVLEESGFVFALSAGREVGLGAALPDVLWADFELGVAVLTAEALGLATDFESDFLFTGLCTAELLDSKFLGSDAFFAVGLLLTLGACFSLLTDFSLLPRFLPSDFLSLPTDLSFEAVGFDLDSLTIAATSSSFRIAPALATPNCLAVAASSCLVLEFKSAAVDKIETPARKSNDKNAPP